MAVEDRLPHLAGAVVPVAGPVTAQAVEELAGAAGISTGGDDLPRVSRRWITLLAVGVFGVYVAYVTPVAISLSIRVRALAPGNDEFLGYILSAGSLSTLLIGPVVGILSDRTRARLGRRRPWMIAGTAGGVAALAVMAIAPNPLVLGIGWCLAQICFSQVVNLFTVIQADRLPADQRGKVAGITGLMQQVAPVVGAVIGGSLAANPVPLFLVPGLFAVVLVGLFVVRYREEDSRGLVFPTRLTVRSVLAQYAFNPLVNRDFAWNWIGRLVFFFGLTLNTTYTTFFFASKLDIAVADVAPLLATVGLLGIVGTIGGALGGGFLTDRIGRRKPLVMAAAIIFCASAFVLAFAPNLPVLIAGSFLMTLAIGIFSSVDQALMIDVLPDKSSDAGRYVAVAGYSISIPQAAAPAVASLILLVGSSGGGDKDYPMLYVVAGLTTIVGALLIMRVRSVR